MRLCSDHVTLQAAEFYPINCPSDWTYGAGQPHVGLCPIFLVIQVISFPVNHIAEPQYIRDRQTDRQTTNYSIGSDLSVYRLTVGPKKLSHSFYFLNYLVALGLASKAIWLVLALAFKMLTSRTPPCCQEEQEPVRGTRGQSWRLEARTFRRGSDGKPHRPDTVRHGETQESDASLPPGAQTLRLRAGKQWWATKWKNYSDYN